MTISTPEQIRQASHYRAVQARLWGEKKKTKPAVEKVIKALPRPPSDFSYHVELYRWHLDLISTSIKAGFKVQEPTEYQPYEQEITFDFKNAVKSVEQIAMDVLWDFPGVKLKDIRGPRRTEIFIRPRQLAMYQIKMQRPDLSYQAIGRWFGGRDHTSCMYSVTKIQAEMGDQESIEKMRRQKERIDGYARLEKERAAA